MAHFEVHHPSYSNGSTDHGHSHTHDGVHYHAAHDHGHTHENLEHPGRFEERDVPLYGERNWAERAFTVGIGGPVGSGKTALMRQLCSRFYPKYNVAAVTNDIFTKEDAEFLLRCQALPADRVRAIETGGCPHAAIREDISANLTALEELQARLGTELLLIESGGDNLAANYSRELADYIIYVIDVAGGDKIPRKGGPGITQSDLLVINKKDLAEHVGASLEVMERDAGKMRSAGPTIFTNMRSGEGADEVMRYILDAYRASGAEAYNKKVTAKEGSFRELRETSIEDLKENSKDFSGKTKQNKVLCFCVTVGKLTPTVHRGDTGEPKDDEDENVLHSAVLLESESDRLFLSVPLSIDFFPYELSDSRSRIGRNLPTQNPYFSEPPQRRSPYYFNSDDHETLNRLSPSPWGRRSTPGDFTTNGVGNGNVYMPPIDTPPSTSITGSASLRASPVKASFMSASKQTRSSPSPSLARSGMSPSASAAFSPSASSLPTSGPTPVKSGSRSGNGNTTSPSANLTGKWEHPAFAEITKRQAHVSFTDVDRSVIKYNTFGLFLLTVFVLTGWFAELRRRIDAYTYRYLYQYQYQYQYQYVGVAYAGTVYLFGITCILNIIKSLWKLFKPSLTYSNYALTPPQRKLLGLNPNISVKPLHLTDEDDAQDHDENELRYEDVKPPRYERSSPSMLRANFVSEASPRDRDSARRMVQESPSYRTLSSSAARQAHAVQQTPQSPVSPLAGKTSGISPVSPLTSYLLRTSPLNMENEPIRDENALEKLLERSELKDSYHAAAAAYGASAGTLGGPATLSSPAGAVGGLTTASSTPFGSFTTGTPIVQRFHTASKFTPGLERVVKERIEDGLVFKDPSQVLVAELNVESYIDEWTENMRKWLAVKVVGPLAKRIDEVDRLFKENGLEDLDCKSATYMSGIASAISMPPPPATTTSSSLFGAPLGASTGSALGTTSLFGAPSKTTGSGTGFGFGTSSTSAFGKSTTSSSLFGGSTGSGGLGTGFGKPATVGGPATTNKPQNLVQLVQSFPSQPIVYERMKLESYLTMFEYGCRGYIVERIKTLAQGGCLSAYQWNGGGKYEGRAWNQDNHPTDAHLVMHLFCRFMDEKMPVAENAGALYGSHPFSSKYFVGVDSKPDVTRSMQIRFYAKHPPHFNLVVEKTIWDVYPKRNNVFQTLCLFAHYVKITSSGYLGLLNLGSKSVDLISVIAGGPMYSEFEARHQHRRTPRSSGDDSSDGRNSTNERRSVGGAAAGSSSIGAAGTGRSLLGTSNSGPSAGNIGSSGSSINRGASGSGSGSSKQPAGTAASTPATIAKRTMTESNKSSPFFAIPTVPASKLQPGTK
ncbi:hypothetical protein HK102_006755 [Quaeritorhiza haematococci]|nr:hypothetical protein HK102_006755 [Quaeritorhiza haematococci]